VVKRLNFQQYAQVVKRLKISTLYTRALHKWLKV